MHLEASPEPKMQEQVNEADTAGKEQLPIVEMNIGEETIDIQEEENALMKKNSSTVSADSQKQLYEKARDYTEFTATSSERPK